MFSYTVFWPTVILAPFAIAFMIIWKCTGYYMAMYLAGITSISGDIMKRQGSTALTGCRCSFRSRYRFWNPWPVSLWLPARSMLCSFLMSPIFYLRIRAAAQWGDPARAVWRWYGIFIIRHSAGTRVWDMRQLFPAYCFWLLSWCRWQGCFWWLFLCWSCLFSGPRVLSKAWRRER